MSREGEDGSEGSEEGGARIERSEAGLPLLDYPPAVGAGERFAAETRLEEVRGQIAAELFGVIAGFQSLGGRREQR